MGGVLRPGLANMIGVGLTAFITIWLIDRGLRMAGKPQWTTSGT